MTPRLLLACALWLGCGLAAAQAPDTGAPGPDAPVAADVAADAGDALDPWQPFNRRVHRFNTTLDRILLRPVARGYVRVVPERPRGAISQFFRNLQQPVSALNLLLQGRPGQAGTALGRFLFNATLGFGGLADPASAIGMPLREQDSGQTLARWGWTQSRYVVLPVFGPATVRDGVGKGISLLPSPVSRLSDAWGPGVSVMYGVDLRSRFLGADAMLADAPDEYRMIRDVYLQRRRCQVADCSDDVPDYVLPDYDYEVPDFDWRR